MGYGIRISKRGYSVTSEKRSKKVGKSDERFLSYMISGIAIPYLEGAAITLKRYLEAAAQLTKDANKTFTCLHEASSLLEHLDTVDRYIIMCDEKHALHKKILDMRNHIRHDLRDNLNHESNDGRTQRAKKLGIREGLLVDISFTESSIKIGNTELSAAEILEFIQYAEALFIKHIKDAQSKGRITGVEIAGE